MISRMRAWGLPLVALVASFLLVLVVGSFAPGSSASSQRPTPPQKTTPQKAGPVVVRVAVDVSGASSGTDAQQGTARSVPDGARVAGDVDGTAPGSGSGTDAGTGTGTQVHVCVTPDGGSAEQPSEQWTENGGTWCATTDPGSGQHLELTLRAR